MPIYKQDTSGTFVPFEQTPFPDLERTLEDWIETNPHLLLEDEQIAIFARQPRTKFGKYLDLLGIDKTGATVIVELKRGETPRDVVAQALEYAAWIDSLTIDDLDAMAEAYSASRGSKATSLADVYQQVFADDAGDESAGDGAASRVTFNNRQRIVIVAEHIADEVEQTLRYLRTRQSADVYGVQFSVHKAGSDTIITTTTVVGREQPSKPQQPRDAREREADESILARAKTPFMREAVTGIERWTENAGVPGLTVDHSTSSEHFIRHLGTTLVFYYHAAGWLYMQLYNATDAEITLLRSRLGKPESLMTREGWNSWRFHVADESDLSLLKEVVLSRAVARTGGGP